MFSGIEPVLSPPSHPIAPIGCTERQHRHTIIGIGQASITGRFRVCLALSVRLLEVITSHRQADGQAANASR